VGLEEQRRDFSFWPKADFLNLPIEQQMIAHIIGVEQHWFKTKIVGKAS
jgi:hypothetical protein